MQRLNAKQNGPFLRFLALLSLLKWYFSPGGISTQDALFVIRKLLFSEIGTFDGMGPGPGPGPRRGTGPAQ